MSTRKEQKDRARAERLALEAKRRRAARRRRRLRQAGATVALAAGLGVAGIVIASASSVGSGQPPPMPAVRLAPLRSLGKLAPAPPPGALGPEGVPLPEASDLAGTGAAAGGQSVDGISCLGSEQLLFHIHAHLTLFVDGVAWRIPAGIGIVGPQVIQTAQGPFVGGGSCFYWLHTHAADGIIHIESPIRRLYTLGDFFDVWGQPLSPTRLGPLRGRLVALYDGRRYLGDPRQIPLTAHAQIQLEVGRPLRSPETITFPAGL
jgi:hypothetical protein